MIKKNMNSYNILMNDFTGIKCKKYIIEVIKVNPNKKGFNGRIPLLFLMHRLPSQWHPLHLQEINYLKKKSDLTIKDDDGKCFKDYKFCKDCKTFNTPRSNLTFSKYCDTCYEFYSLEDMFLKFETTVNKYLPFEYQLN